MNDNMDVYDNGYMVFEDDKIIDIGSLNEIDETIYKDVINGENGILIPGMINAHTHVGMIPFRSLGDDCKDRLRKLLFPLENEFMNEELVYSSTKYAVSEMLLGGVTTFADMYYFEDTIANACSQMKVRAVLGETVVNFPSCDSSKPSGGLEYGENFIKKWKNHELITPMIAPHAPNTNDTEILVKIKEMSKNYQVPISIHLSEMDYELDYFREKYDMTPVEYLDSIGFLGDNLIAAHCILLTEKDIKILRKNKVKIVHCIGANTKAAKGIAPIKELINSNIDIGLGTDGPSSGNTLDIFTQLKLFANFHKNEAKDRSLFPAREILKIATVGGANVLQMSDKIGTLEIGKAADFVIVETKSINMFPNYDPYSVLVYSANASNVDTVYVNGTCLVKNKKLQLVNIGDIRSELEYNMKGFKSKAIRYLSLNNC